MGGWSGSVVCVVSLDCLCIWQVHVSVYYAMWMPAPLRCTQCSKILGVILILPQALQLRDR